VTSPLTPEILIYDLKGAGDPQFAPDGTRLIYTLGQTERGQTHGTSQIWLCDRDGGNARQLTGGGEHNGGGRWSPDGAQIAFVSDRGGDRRPERNGGDGKEKGAGLYILPIGEGGEAREVTRHAQGIGDLAWSPDGRHPRLHHPLRPGEPGRATRAGRGRHRRCGSPAASTTSRIIAAISTILRTQVFIVDVASGERRRLSGDEPEPADYNFPQWSPDGRTIAASRPNHNGMQGQLALLDVATGGMTLLGPEEGTIGVWSWSPNGARLIYSGDTRQTYQSDFFVHTVADGTTRRLTDDLQVLPVAGFPTIIGPSQPVWLDERQVLFHAVRAGASGVHIIDSESGVVEPVKSWRAISGQVSTSRDHRYLAHDYSRADTIGEIAITDMQTDETTIITHHNDALLAAHPTSEPEHFAIGRGKYEIEAWILKPHDFDPSKRYPLILDVHGGPNGFYGWGFNAIQQTLAAAGFVVVYANPRGSSSYGREFTQQVIRDWGNEDFQGSDGGRGQGDRAALRRPGAAGDLRLQLRRLHDLLDDRADHQIQGGGLRRAVLRPRIVLRHQRHRPHLRAHPVRRGPARGPGVVRRPLPLDVHPPRHDPDPDRARRGGSSLPDRPGGADVHRPARRRGSRPSSPATPGARTSSCAAARRPTARISSPARPAGLPRIYAETGWRGGYVCSRPAAHSVFAQGCAPVRDDATAPPHRLITRQSAGSRPDPHARSRTSRRTTRAWPRPEPRLRRR
jgi:dipeptidyl aminopeptidase/acylaminoacyl peptidase